MKVVKSAAILAIALLTGTSVHAADTTIKVLYQANHPALYKSLVEAFSAYQGSIAVELVPGDGNYEGIMQTLMRSKLTNNVPDVAFLGFDFMRQTGQSNVAVALDPFIETEGDMSNAGYLDNVKDLCVHGDDTIGMPFAVSLPIVLYNVDLLNAAGVETQNLTFSWDEIAEIASRVDALGSESQGIYFTYDASGNWTLKALIESAGGRLMSLDDSEITFDDVTGQWAFSVLDKIGRSGFFNVSRNQARQSFSAGALGILVDSSSGLDGFIDQASGVFEMRVGPFPMPNEQGRVPAGGNCVVMTTQDTERQSAAWEFIKFVTSGEGQAILADNSGYVPNNRNALTGDSKIAVRFTRDPNYSVVADMLKRVGPSYAFPGPNSTRITHLIENYMRRVLVNEVEPEDALRRMRAEVEGLL